MEHAKQRTCEECGKSFEPGGFSGGWVCPTCNAAFLGRIRTRLLKAVFWGGVTALALLIAGTLIRPGDMSLSFFAGAWVVATVLFLLPGGGWWGSGGGWGNGGGGNGGG